MFRHEGLKRSDRNNVYLAGYLALVAGFVNSGGFVLIGSFTSHVTGNVGRLSTDVMRGDFGNALFAAFLVGAFYVGSLLASMILQGRSPTQRPRAYAMALAVEGLLLATFIVLAGLSPAGHPRSLDEEAAILCMAMGMQNSLVTRLSGAVVRTTHLTGVITDLGIETAAWLQERVGRGREPGPPDAKRRARAVLLLTIVGTFTVGALLGAKLTAAVSRWAMAGPACAIWIAAIYASFQKPITSARDTPSTGADAGRT